MSRPAQARGASGLHGIAGGRRTASRPRAIAKWVFADAWRVQQKDVLAIGDPGAGGKVADLLSMADANSAPSLTD